MASAEGFAGGRFTDWLRDGAEPHWSEACNHRFTRELAADTLDDAVFARYLIQDYAFLDALVGLVGHAVGHAPTMAEKTRLAGFLGVLTGGEDDFFKRSFAALGIREAAWRALRRHAATQGLAALFGEASEDGYDAVLSVLLPVEWIYLTWAEREAGKRPGRFYLSEWIALHNDPGFAAFVGWMRDQLDRRGPAADAVRQSLLRDRFRRAAALEVAFFDAAYPGAAPLGRR